MVFYAVFSETDMDFERPVIDTSLWLEERAVPETANPPYCDDTDFLYSENWAYRNFRCVESPRESEVFFKSRNSFWLTTMWTEQLYRRREHCRLKPTSTSTANATAAAAAAAPATNPQTCARGKLAYADETQGETTSNYVLDITTQKNLFFTVSYSTSRVAAELDMNEVTLLDAKGEEIKAGDRGVQVQEAGKVLAIPIDTLMQMSVTDDEFTMGGAGHLLDTRNRNSGGFCVDDAKMTPELDKEALRLGLVNTVDARCPRYRTSGLSIIVDVEISNRNSLRTKTTIRAKLTSRGQWISSHAWTTGHYVGPDGAHYHRERKPYGIQFTLSASGLLGATTLTSVVLTFASYSALLGAVVVLLDFMGAYLVAGFEIGKYLEAVEDPDSGQMVVKTVKRAGNSVIIR